MNETNVRRSKPAAIGFLVGAALVIAVLALLFLKRTPQAPAASTTQVATTAATTASPGAMAAPHAEAPPPSPHSFSERSGAPGPPLLSGTLTLDPSISQGPGARVTVFVIARTRMGKGETVLARRIDVDSFPAPFAMSAADSMRAGAMPDLVTLEARIDLDGDAMTREPGSPGATLQSVKMGSAGLALVLKPELSSPSEAGGPEANPRPVSPVTPHG